MIRELAFELGFTDDTVINWEVRGMKPHGESFERVNEFIKAGG